jgi:hypothetical protein
MQHLDTLESQFPIRDMPSSQVGDAICFVHAPAEGSYQLSKPLTRFCSLNIQTPNEEKTFDNVSTHNNSWDRQILVLGGRRRPMIWGRRVARCKYCASEPPAAKPRSRK